MRNVISRPDQRKHGPLNHYSAGKPRTYPASGERFILLFRAYLPTDYAALTVLLVQGQVRSDGWFQLQRCFVCNCLSASASPFTEIDGQVGYVLAVSCQSAVRECSGLEACALSWVCVVPPVQWSRSHPLTTRLHTLHLVSCKRSVHLQWPPIHRSPHSRCQCPDGFGL